VSNLKLHHRRMCGKRSVLPVEHQLIYTDLYVSYPDIYCIWVVVRVRLVMYVL
jgi:hypothetical protein